MGAEKMRGAFILLSLVVMVRGALKVPIDNQIFSYLTNKQGIGANHGPGLRLEKKVTIVTADGPVTKLKYSQTDDNLKVYDTAVSCTLTNAGPTDITGSTYQIVHKNNLLQSQPIGEEAALDLALAHFANKRNWDPSVAKDLMEWYEVELALDPACTNGTDEKIYSLNFKIEANGTYEATRPFYELDAISGAVIETWEGLDSTYVKGTGPGGNKKTGKYQFGGNKYGAFVVDKVGNKCKMETKDVKTIDLKHSNGGITKAFEYDCDNNKNENTYKPVNGAYSPLNDAHAFGKVTFDMFQAYAGVSPLKFQLVLRVHYGTNYGNAFWDGRVMTFGDGSSSTTSGFYPLVDLNVVTHEASHGFTGQNSELKYAQMSGGMNEAYSDIAGEAAEFFMKKKVDWQVGREILKGNRALRYFEKPSNDGRSIDHANQYYNGIDVHYSSGVYNRAFYLLCTKYSALYDIPKAFQIFTLANQIYWTKYSTFDQGACGVEKAAKDYKYDVTAVTRAFQEVGVSCPDTPKPTDEPHTGPTTAAPVSTTLPLGGGNCDFNAKTYCDWTADVNSQSKNNKWQLWSGNTPSGRKYKTGPTGDYSSSGKSYYIYMETSSGSGPKGTQIVLHRSFLADPSIPDRCMTFAYHMYGSDIGTLEVTQVRQSGTTSLFKKVGQQSNDREWLLQTININQAQDYKIQIIASKGKSFQGDIAVDAISFSNTKCPLVPVPKCTTLTVGNSNSNSKQVSISSRYECPKRVDKTNWLGGHNYGDKFDVDQIGEQATVKRIDANIGWGMQLQFKCCTRGSSSTVAPTKKPSTREPITTGSKTLPPKTLPPKTRPTQPPKTLPPKTQPTLPPKTRPTLPPKTRPTLPPRTNPTANPNDVSSLSSSFESAPVAWALSSQSSRSAWKFSSSSTGSFRTGPRGPAVRQRPAGMYAYVDSSYPNFSLKSTMTSRRVSGAHSCFYFFYHMHGRDVGTLRVMEDSGSVTSQMYEMIGDQGQGWKLASFPLTSTIPFQLKFIVETLSGPEGDIALDNFNVVPGYCDIPVDRPCVNGNCSTVPMVEGRETVNPCIGNYQPKIGGFVWMYDRCDKKDSRIQEVTAGATIIIDDVKPHLGACLTFGYKVFQSAKCDIVVSVQGFGAGENDVMARYPAASEGEYITKSVSILPILHERDTKVHLSTILDGVACYGIGISHASVRDGLC